MYVCISKTIEEKNYVKQNNNIINLYLFIKNVHRVRAVPNWLGFIKVNTQKMDI